MIDFGWILFGVIKHHNKFKSLEQKLGCYRKCPGPSQIVMARIGLMIRTLDYNEECAGFDASAGQRFFTLFFPLL
jgi:hypothetical protein